MSKRVVAPLLGAMAIVALVAFGGCGGSDDESTTSTSTQASTVTVKSSSLSKAEYRKRVNQICAEGTGKVEKLVRKVIATGSGVEKVEAVFLPIVDDWVEEIQALGAPEGDEAEVEAFLTALQKDVEEAEAKPAKELGELGKTFKESGNHAREAGFQTCALG